eukprot:1339155-Prymnesium_polylepis.1
MVAVSEPTVVAVAKRVHLAAHTQHQAVRFSRRHRAYLHTLERLDDLWRELALLIAVPKPAKRRAAEGVDLAAAAQHQAMNATRRQCNGSYALQPFDDFG